MNMLNAAIREFRHDLEDMTPARIGKMQAERWLTTPYPGGPLFPADMAAVAVYRDVDGELWVRPREEFEDGRFVAVKP